MNRKIISTLLALVLCFSFALSVSADPKAVDFVVDECGYLAKKMERCSRFVGQKPWKIMISPV